jgi:predicted transcriptional regulator of viral defense system
MKRFAIAISIRKHKVQITDLTFRVYDCAEEPTMAGAKKLLNAFEGAS